MINAVPPLPETLNSLLQTGANTLPSHCAKPSSLTSFVATKNGNSVGIISPAHIFKPSAAESDAMSGYATREVKNISAQAIEMIFFTGINSLSMY